MNKTELAWAAGFFDGEGSFGKHRTGPQTMIGQINKEVLERFALAVGLGNVTGPYVTTKGKFANPKPMYAYRAYGFEKTQAIIALLWNFLSEPKRKQAIEVLTTPWTRVRPCVSRPVGSGG